MGKQVNYEEKKNKFTLRCIKIATVIYTIAWILNILGIFIIDSKIMNSGMIGTIIFLSLSVLFEHATDLGNPHAKYILIFFLISMVTFFSTILTYHTTMFMLFPMIYCIQYHSKKVTVYTYVLTCIGFLISVFVGFRVGVCDANMLLLTTDTTSVYADKLVQGSFDINNSYFPLFLFYIFPRCLILAALIPLQNHITAEIKDKTVREIETRRLVEIDGLTGLYNRNKYIDMLSGHYHSCNNIAVIYCDLNNLKKVNDTNGHEYGDILIIGIANILKKYTSIQCNTYRLGGDEFVTILENPKSGQGLKLFNDIKEDIDKCELEGGLVLSVAIGLAEGVGDNVEDIINKADELMYKDKARMKTMEKSVDK